MVSLTYIDKISKFNTSKFKYMRSFSLFLLGCLYVIVNSCSDSNPRKIEVLFLGHNSIHHNSEKNMPIMASALANKGINFTYTTSTTDLNKSFLSKFDALMIYANHDSITIEQESALLDFVEEGKGFLPIHCASWCFRNSDKYVDLVGAQFKSHGTGIFTAEIVNDQHPITMGLEPFKSWDETYVNHKHNTNRIVLSERIDSRGREPWTWVREYGKGRVFYTASGHDQRTWDNSGFQELIFRAILWTVGDQVKNLWEQLEFPEHRYTVSKDIANYEKRSQPLMLQEPLKQTDSEKFIQVPIDFTLEVFATEPDIVNPIFINWDEKGRLWVIETIDYPNQVKKNGPGNDRIKVCEDTNGDGKADKFTVFADGLSIPTSLVFSNGGIIVSAAPDFLFLKDTDGDGKADIRETLISGWGTFDTHAGPSNLKYGFDNHIWGTVGYSAFEGVIDGQSHKFSQGIYRFNPEATDFEFVTSTSNNTWGLGFSETFDVFASTANNAHSWYLGIPDRYFQGINGIPKIGSKKIAGYYAFHPITRNIRQVDVFGGFTAAAGHNLYTARAFPIEYWNSMALVCEPTGNLLAKGALKKDGAGFVLEDQWNLLASSDEWVSPVHAEVGPDGAVWVADWYNFIIQHNPTPTKERGGYQAETGKGNAHVNPLRDRSYGRIYRIVSKNSPAYRPITLDKQDQDQLIKALENDNLFWRLTAQRLLVEQGDESVLQSLIKLLENTSVDELDLNGAAVHALWTMHGLDILKGDNQAANEAAIAALKHPAAGVRKAAVQVLPETDWAGTAIYRSGVLKDSAPHTQLAALLRVSEMPTNLEIGTELYELSKSTQIAQDLWLSQALFVAANRHYPGFFNGYQSDPTATTFQIAKDEKKDQPPSLWNKWDNPGQITRDWPTFESGAPWEETVLPNFNGRVIAYKEIEVKTIPSEAFLHLGKIGQSDRAFVNGTMLHETRNDPEKLREYEVPIDALVEGMNYLIVTIEDEKGAGGFLGPDDQMFVEAGEEIISTSGTWKYYIQERKSRGINYSDFDPKDQLAARFVAYNSGGQSGQEITEVLSLDENAFKITLKAVRNEMKYDQEELVVPAGMTIQIEFENDDLMQHNLLIIVPGSLETVGKAADALAQLPEGQEKQYVPDVPQVLYATALINPGESFVLQFTAPSEPGEYPFVCTFPGHWQTMNGILKVKGVAN